MRHGYCAHPKPAETQQASETMLPILQGNGRRRPWSRQQETKNNKSDKESIALSQLKLLSQPPNHPNKLVSIEYSKDEYKKN